MAKTILTTEYTADNTKALKAAKEVEDAVSKIGREGRKSSNKIKDGFESVNDIFGGLLPRNMQTIIRRFRSTSRAVSRAGRSFKVLKTAIASLGIPLLVMALAELITNFEYYTDLLGITSKEARQLAEEQQKVNEEMERAAMATDPYVQILRDLNAEEDVRQQALKQLSRTLREVANLDLEAADAQDKLSDAVERNARLVEARAKIENLDERIKQKKEEFKEEGKWYQTVNQQERIRIERAQELEDLATERQNLLEGILKEEAEITAEIKRQADEAKEAADAERAAEQERLRRQKEREQLLAREEKALDRRQKQEEQLGMTQEELMMDELDRQEREELALVQSEEAKNAIREYYAQKWDDWYTKFQEDAQAKLDAEADREEQEQERENERRIQGQMKLQAKLDDIEQQRMLDSLQGEELEMMQNAIFYDSLLDQADEFGYDRLAIEEQREIEETAIRNKYQQQRIDDAKREQEAVVAAKTKMYSEVASLAGQAAGLAEEGSAAAKALAVTEVLLSQGIAMANASAGAAKAASATGPAAPFTLAAFQLQMVGSVISAFTSIKRILDQADTASSGIGSGGGGRGGGGGPRGVTPLVPNLNFDVENNAAQNVNVSAYVVQSQLQGSQLEYNQALNRVTL